MSPERKIARLRLWVLVLTIVVVFGAISGPIIVQALVSNAGDETQLEVGCQIIRSELRTHEDLADIRRVLGLPLGPPPQEVPPECDGH
jgi:hypothetical protein